MKNRLNQERIDISLTLNQMSHNIFGHEDRMKAHTAAAQAEMRKYRMILKIVRILYKRAEKPLRGKRYERNPLKYILTEVILSRQKATKDIKEAYL